MTKEKTCTTTKSHTLIRVDVEIHLNKAAVELRAAWLLCKRNGMEATAKEIADTVLDLETAANELHEKNVGAFRYS